MSSIVCLLILFQRGRQRRRRRRPRADVTADGETGSGSERPYDVTADHVTDPAGADSDT